MFLHLSRRCLTKHFLVRHSRREIRGLVWKIVLGYMDFNTEFCVIQALEMWFPCCCPGSMHVSELNDIDGAWYWYVLASSGWAISNDWEIFNDSIIWDYMIKAERPFPKKVLKQVIWMKWRVMGVVKRSLALNMQILPEIMQKYINSFLLINGWCVKQIMFLPLICFSMRKWPTQFRAAEAW